jgi:putative two-component system response regulator
MRILVVDDTPVNLRVLTCALEALGFQADRASGGAEAVEAARAVPYDLVFMDLMMPGVSGFEAARRIRAETPADRSPGIVAVSAAPELRGTSDFELAGFDGFLAKPVEIRRLAAYVLDALEGRLGRQPLEVRRKRLRAELA